MGIYIHTSGKQLSDALSQHLIYQQETAPAAGSDQK